MHAAIGDAPARRQGLTREIIVPQRRYVSEACVEAAKAVFWVLAVFAAYFTGSAVAS